MGCYREKFQNFVAWAEPDPKTALFAFYGTPSTVLHTAYRKQFYPKAQTNGTDGRPRLNVCLLLVCGQAFGRYRLLKGAEKWSRDHHDD